MLIKPCLCLHVFSSEIQGEHYGDENKDDSERNPVLTGTNKKSNKRESKEQDDNIKLHGKKIKFHFKRFFIVFIHHPHINPEIKVLDV
jgi:hypothetical protein